jgi:hypothetical protein
VADSATSGNSSHRIVVIGVVVTLVIVVAFSVFCFWIRHRRKHLNKASEPSAFVYCQSSDDSSSFNVSHQYCLSLATAVLPVTYISTPPPRLSSAANYPTSEPPSYKAEAGPYLVRTPVGGSRHRTPQPANPTSDPPPYI